MTSESGVFRVLVTGANSGLGFSVCCRLIDEFLYTKAQDEKLAIVITTRDQKKADDTTKRLEKYLRQSISQKQKKGGLKGFEQLLQQRVIFEHELLDLNSLHSVRRLGQRRRQQAKHINAIILNAGIGGWTGINWPKAIWAIMTDFIYALTYPTYKISGEGALTKPQVAGDESSKLGQIFCSNVFGHYVLAKELMPLLQQSQDGRIIWVSSLEAYAWTFDVDNVQGLGNPMAYEGSKRLTDILALSSRLPETKPLLADFFSTDPEAGAEQRGQPQGNVTMYLSHPGICATGIFPLPWILTVAMVAVTYVARWLGSIWHTCDSYKGACAPVWLTLAPAEQLRGAESRAGVGKWGSATDIAGNERAERTEVEGWGYGGVVGDNKGRFRGRVRGLKDLTKEDREKFVQLGRECWSTMEKMRLDLEAKLEREGSL